MEITRLAFLLALSALPLACIAGNPAAIAKDHDDAVGLRSSYKKCADASGGVTAALLSCNAREAAFQDARLNEAYAAAIAKLSEYEKAKLRDEESKWTAYRNYYCAADSVSGTAADVESSGCYLEETAKQANALESRPGQPTALAQYRAIGLSASYAKCVQASRAHVPESQACLNDEYKHQDVRLNHAYKKLMSELDQNGQAKWRSNEKIWIAFRDTHCALASEPRVDQKLRPSDCLVKETAKQAGDLENHAYLESLKR